MKLVELWYMRLLVKQSIWISIYLFSPPAAFFQPLPLLAPWPQQIVSTVVLLVLGRLYAFLLDVAINQMSPVFPGASSNEVFVKDWAECVSWFTAI